MAEAQAKVPGEAQAEVPAEAQAEVPAEGSKAYKGTQYNCYKDQPLELNWVECDLYEGDLFDLDEADSELLNFEAFRDEADVDFFQDLHNIRQQHYKDSPIILGLVEEAHQPENVPGDLLVSTSIIQRTPSYPPKHFELDFQTVAKVARKFGCVNLCDHDSRKLDQCERKSQEYWKSSATTNQPEHDCQALYCLPNHQQQKGQSSRQGRGLSKLGKVDTTIVKMLAQPASNALQGPGGGTDLLELQKVALSNMKVLAQKSSAIASLFIVPQPLRNGDSELLELHKVALSNMSTISHQTIGPAQGPPSMSTEGDLLELQKVALASMKYTPEKTVSLSTFLVSQHVPSQTLAEGDLSESPNNTLEANLLNSSKKPSSHCVPLTTLQSFTTVPQQQVKEAEFRDVKTKLDSTPIQIGGDSFPLQNVESTCKCTGNQPPPKLVPPSLHQGKGGKIANHCKCKETMKSPLMLMPTTQGEVTLKCTCKVNETLLNPNLTTSQQLKEGGDLLELQKAAMKNIPNLTVSSTVLGMHEVGGKDLLASQQMASTSVPKSSSQQGEGEGDSSKLEKIVPKSVFNHDSSSIPLIAVPQQNGDGDLLELQKIALRSIQTQSAPPQTPQKLDRKPDFLEEQEKSPKIVQSQIISAQICNKNGGDLLELQRVALATMSSGKWEEGRKVTIEEEKVKQQKSETEVGGTSSTSSPTMLRNMSSRDPLEKLLQEISTKDQALQFASKTIQEKDQLLQEYEGSLASTLNLLQSINVQRTNAKVETAKVLMEAEEICGNLKVACSVVENLDSSTQTFSKGIQLSAESKSESATDDHFIVSKQNDKLGENHIEINERMNLIEDLLKELHNIDMARNKAEEGCKLQIQKNEQLIAELQQLDKTHDPQMSKEDICDRGHTSQNSEDIGRQFGNDISNKCQQTYDNSLHLVYEDPNNQGEVKSFENTFVNATKTTEENLCDHVYKHSDDNANIKNGCDPAYENPSDQVTENLCDHVYITHDQSANANAKSCVHNYENPYNPTNEGPTKNLAKGKSCDHLYERLSDIKINDKLCDHVYESHCCTDNKESDIKLFEDVYKSHMNAPSCDHAYNEPSDQTRAILCNHEYENPDNWSMETQCNCTYDSPPEQTHDSPCEHDFNQTDEKPCNHVFEETNEKLYCDHIYQQTYKNPNDNKLDSSCDHTYELKIDNMLETPFDHAYEDGKDCSPIHEWEDIGSLTFNLPNWMSCESVSQPAKSLNQTKGQNYKVIRPKEHKLGGHHLAKKSSPDALWEHLQYLLRKELQPCDNIEKLQLTTQLNKLQGDLDLKTHELQEYIDRGTSKTDQLHSQIIQLQTALLQEQDDRRKFLLQRNIEETHGPTKADLEQKDKVIHEMHFQMNKLETALRNEQDKMKEVLAQKTNEMEVALCQEREAMRQALAQHSHAIMSYSPSNVNTISDTNLQDTKLKDLNQQLHEMQRELEKREDDRKALMLSVKVDIDNLQRILHEKDENIQELKETIARKEAAWQIEKHKTMKCFDDLETSLLVKEEEVINLTHALEVIQSSISSHPPSDEVKFMTRVNHEESHFFHKQGVREEKQEVLDLRCEVLSLQDCLESKSQAIKTMEKELARSYNIVSDLKNKLRVLQEFEQSAQRPSQSKDLIDQLRSTQNRLQKSLGERALMSNKIQDLLARCKYLEEFEHLYREGTSDIKDQTIMELENELERNVQIIKNMQAHCNEYKAKGKNTCEPTQRLCNDNTCDSLEHHAQIKLSQLNEENKALLIERDQLRSQIKQKDQIIIQLQQAQNQNMRPSSGLPSKYQQNAIGKFCCDERSRSLKNTAMSSTSAVEHVKVESPEVSTLRELLKGQWKLQKVMEDRLNTMMAYISDRVDEFEQISPSDTTSNSSGPLPNTELNHFHVEAKLMKLQLEQQLQILRQTIVTSLPTSEVTSPRSNFENYPHNCFLTQNMQLVSEKNALEDSAQTLQEKTSRLLNKLTFMRAEFNLES